MKSSHVVLTELLADVDKSYFDKGIIVTRKSLSALISVTQTGVNALYVPLIKIYPYASHTGHIGTHV